MRADKTADQSRPPRFSNRRHYSAKCLLTNCLPENEVVYVYIYIYFPPRQGAVGGVASALRPQVFTRDAFSNVPLPPLKDCIGN
jgi:hypothetical protein